MNNKSFLKSVVTLGGSSVFQAIATFISIIFVSSALGLVEYGVFAFTLALAMILSVLSNTLSWQGLLKLESVSKRTILYCFCIDLVISFVSSIVFVTLLGLLTSSILDRHVEAWQYCFVFVIFFQNNGTIISLIRQKSLYKRQAVVDALSGAVKVIAVGISSTTDSIELLIFSFVSSEIIRWLGYIFISGIRSECSYEGGDNVTVIGQLQAIYKFSIWGVLNEIAHIPSSQLDRIIISSFVGLELVAIYDMFKRVLTAVVNLTNPIIQITYPIYIQRLKSESFKNVMSFALKLVCILFCILSIAYITIYLTSYFWMKYLFQVEIPDNLTETAGLLLINLSLTLTFVYSFVPIHPLYLALGHAKNSFYISFLGAIFVLVSLFVFAIYTGIEHIPFSILAGDLVIILYKLKKLLYRWKIND